MSNEAATLLSAFTEFRISADKCPGLRRPSPEDIAHLKAEFSRRGGKVVEAHNRRYLGNKAAITTFIRETLTSQFPDITSVCDIFAGTGSVAQAFADKRLITNDLLYSNYVAHMAWFGNGDFRPELIWRFTEVINNHSSTEDNYMRCNFANTYFSADDCSKIGVARELIELLRTEGYLLGKEYEILITTIIYGMDRYANTVGHYDAYRKGAPFRAGLRFPLVMPDTRIHPDNLVFNTDANELVRTINVDLLYLDPPYNSRQYSDAYHLLENVARWQKPHVHGVAKKMDRSELKSAYNSVRAAHALRDLVNHAQCKYIAFSYNNMSSKGNARSNARICDSEILDILAQKGTVQTFEIEHKPFNAGKSQIEGNTERLFVCRVNDVSERNHAIVISPINYIGGKGKLLPQLKPLLFPASYFVDVFAGGCNVGINSEAKKVLFNDLSPQLIHLMTFLAKNSPEEIIKQIDHISQQFGLSKTHESSYATFGAESTKGLAAYNKPGFLALRQAYNATPEGSDTKSLLLYALVIFGFNNQLRFNRKGEFNLPVGKRDFNSKMRRKLREFSMRIRELDAEFTVGDFRDLRIDDFPDDTLFYCDPPYLITQATYNENGGWTVTDEEDLLAFLDAIDRSGRKFALSNAVEAKGRINSTLNSWITSRPYRVHELNMSYSNSNYQRKNAATATREILVVNYEK
ncbi:Dam family site-specific DNA-(adenine-N6)-methyltransferase [Trueperella sp. LYQ141]|uniref:Dam family site-specific DNA-(adenine-N6)-methyltransferase n=1 Tax=Trueperella sp. LYQ141 TaxID=3391058 RepID=UPI0039838DA4